MKQLWQRNVPVQVRGSFWAQCITIKQRSGSHPRPIHTRHSEQIDQVPGRWFLQTPHNLRLQRGLDLVGCFRADSGWSPTPSIFWRLTRSSSTVSSDAADPKQPLAAKRQLIQSPVQQLNEGINGRCNARAMRSWNQGNKSRVKTCLKQNIELNHHTHILQTNGPVVDCEAHHNTTHHRHEFQLVLLFLFSRCSPNTPIMEQQIKKQLTQRSWPQQTSQTATDPTQP